MLADLTGCYVRQHGRISPCGVIQTLYNGVPDNRCEELGCTRWSQKLLQYGNGDFRAVIDEERAPKHLIIRQGKREVARIPRSQIFSCEVFKVGVCAGGFPAAILVYGRTPWKNRDANLRAQRLREARRGKKPEVFDNSTFVKVSPLYVGQTLVRIRLGDIFDSGDYQFKMFTLSGQPVRCQVGHWLSKKTWGVE